MNTYQTRARTQGALTQKSRPDDAPAKRPLSKANAVRSTRAALGEVTNKLSQINPDKTKASKVSKARTAGSASKKRSNSNNPAVERAKVAAVVKDLDRKAVSAKGISETTLKPKATTRISKPTAKAVKQPTEPAPVPLDLVPKREIKLENKPVVPQYDYEWDDLDASDKYDPVMVSEYVQDIFAHLHMLEVETMPNPKYMDHQNEITWRMRKILLDWVIEVHNKFRMLPETLFLAANILDRFLSERIVSVGKLQLVGLTCLFIASKYEEVSHPSIKNFLYMADNGYTEDEVLTAERYVLQVLNFGLHYPNPLNFLRRISKAEDYDIQTRTFGKYLMECCLMDHRFLSIKPSLSTAASVYLSRKILAREPIWSNNLRHYSGEYQEKDILPVVTMLLDYLQQQDPSAAVYKKYASKKYMKISLFAAEWIEKIYGSDRSDEPCEDGSEDY